MLKASSPVADKPLYASRLSELLLAMTSHGGQLRTSGEMTSAEAGLRTFEPVGSNVAPPRSSKQLTSAGAQIQTSEQIADTKGARYCTSEPSKLTAAHVRTSNGITEVDRVQQVVSSTFSGPDRTESTETEPAAGRNDNVDQKHKSPNRALHDAQLSGTHHPLPKTLTSPVTSEPATASAPGIGLASRSGSGRALAAPISSQLTLQREPETSNEAIVSVKMTRGTSRRVDGQQ